MKQLLIALLTASFAFTAIANTADLLNAVVSSDKECRLDDCKEGQDIVRGLELEMSKAKFSCRGLFDVVIKNGKFLKAILDTTGPTLTYNEKTNIVRITSDERGNEGSSIFVAEFAMSRGLLKIESLRGYEIKKDENIDPNNKSMPKEVIKLDTMCKVQKPN